MHNSQYMYTDKLKCDAFFRMIYKLSVLISVIQINDKKESATIRRPGFNAHFDFLAFQVIKILSYYKEVNSGRLSGPL